MALYECNVCGYIYNEDQTAIPWNQLDDDWVCPICDSGKSYFKQKKAPILSKSNEKVTEITPPSLHSSSIANIYSGIGYPSTFQRSNDSKEPTMDLIHQMAITGKTVIEPMKTYEDVITWKDILIKGAQLDPFVLEHDAPVITTTIIGKNAKKPLIIEHPIFITHMSFGALSKEMKLSLARGSAEVKTAMCSGEGGILPESFEASYKYIFEYVPNLYSVTTKNLQTADAIEIKIGQGTKPGMGGHLPGKKVTEEIAKIRGKTVGEDIISPSKFKTLQTKDDLRDLVSTLRDISNGRPIGIKIAAGRIEKDLDVISYAGADFVTIDGRGGGTGASPKLIKDATSIPTIFALAKARRYLDMIGSEMDLIITGGLRVSSDFAKALAMGADAVAIGTAAMMATACQQYRVCHNGKCPVGCATQDPELRKRLNSDKGAIRLANYMRATLEDLKTFTRICGKDNVHQLTVEDLCTTNSEIANYTTIPHV